MESVEKISEEKKQRKYEKFEAVRTGFLPITIGIMIVLITQVILLNAIFIFIVFTAALVSVTIGVISILWGLWKKW